MEEEREEREDALRRRLAEERGHLEAATAGRERERREAEERERAAAERERELVALLEAEKESAAAAVAAAASATAAAADSIDARRPSAASSSAEDDDFGGDKVAAALAKAARYVAAGGEGGVGLAIDRATEELQRRLRARESELQMSSTRIGTLEKTQKELADELVRTTRLIDEIGDPRRLASELRELEERHAAALELMGETSEENEELRDRVDALKATVAALTTQLAAADSA